MAKVTKPKPISGFPEYLPHERAVEQQWFDHIRASFERYGFCNIETPSIESLDILNAKGNDQGDDVDKEVYVIERLHKEAGDKEARLALHFDQTVPLARYTAQHFNALTFPFKRYQMQRVWRGERPQAGRFREFYQCDIDVIGIDNLALHFDAEMPAIIWDTLSGLPGLADESIQIQISNRKILMGALDALAVKNPTQATRIIDKCDKLPHSEITDLLKTCCEATPEQCNTLLALAQIKTPDSSFADQVKSLGLSSAIIDEGLDELTFVMNQLSHLPKDSVVADLSIVRGLDYYTGTVYETRFLDDPTYGSICSGGRYDDLASNYINKHLPGVGISIGFSRLFARMLNKGKLDTGRTSPAHILITLPAEDRRTEANTTAQILRERGYNVEIFHSSAKMKRQLSYAEKKGIPYVWFLPSENDTSHAVKSMATTQQSPATPESWTPYDANT